MSLIPSIHAIPCHGKHSQGPTLVREEHKKYERLPNGQVKITTTTTTYAEGRDKPDERYTVEFV